MFDRVDAETLNRWRRLAQRARDELAAAGLTVAAELSSDYVVGAEVEIDSGDDAAGGVFVSWHPHPQLASAAVDRARMGRHDDPVIQHAGTVSEAMRTAMQAILSSAGFAVAPADDDMRPFALKVSSGPQ